MGYDLDFNPFFKKVKASRKFVFCDYEDCDQTVSVQGELCELHLPNPGPIMTDKPERMTRERLDQIKALECNDFFDHEPMENAKDECVREIERCWRLNKEYEKTYNFHIEKLEKLREENERLKKEFGELAQEYYTKDLVKENERLKAELEEEKKKGGYW